MRNGQKISQKYRILFIILLNKFFFSKVKAVCVRLDDLITCIKADHKKRVKVDDPIVFNIFTVNRNPDRSTTGLNGGFVHSLLVIDVLIRMKPVEKDKQELIELCEKQYKGNKTELNVVHEFQQNYSSNKALWWYTRESFLYKMLNKALRIQNIDVLFLFRFFIRDIHRALERNQCQSPVRVYRGQVLSNDELSNLRESIGEFISTTSFFSTTTDRYQALEFLNDLETSNDLYRVLFEINADPRVVTAKPFADISSFSDFSNESEVLFMIGSIFRLTNVRRNNNQIWIIRLTLCGDDEHDLKNLFEYLKDTDGGGENEADLLNFGRVLRRMGKFDLAEKFYRRLLNELPANDTSLSSLYYSLGLVLKDKKDLDSSLECLHRSLDMKMHSSPKDYKSISDSYNVIGNIHRMKHQYNIALSWYEKGIELLEQMDDTGHLRMAHFYNNIANVYEDQEKYVDALGFNKKALIIQEQHLLPNDSDIGLSHNNLGSSHLSLGHYDLALEHYNLALDIKLKSLPSDHPDVAQTYRNKGRLYEDVGKLSKASKYLQKAAIIYRQSLPPQHPDVVNIEEDIKRVSWKLK
jgi:tetratricopeptide (TPR) repeat protein